MQSQTGLARSPGCPPASTGHQRYSLSPSSGLPLVSALAALSHWLGAACGRRSPTQMHQWLSGHSSGAQAPSKSGECILSAAVMCRFKPLFAYCVPCCRGRASQSESGFTKREGGPFVGRNGRVRARQRWSHWVHLNMPPAC